MDLMKIGKFIAECRRKQNLTQLQLAEKLHITDRAVSKWENGRAMPDSSIMLELCEILNISVASLLKGEVVDMENNNKALEEQALALVKEKELSDKRLLRLEIVVGVVIVVVGLALILLAGLAKMEDWLRFTLIGVGLILIFSMSFFLVRIEQVAGYYECRKCGHRYVPTYAQVVNAMHFGRTRYLKCPNCGKRSWNKKVISKS